MSHWNYRVLKINNESFPEDGFKIIEVYYDDKGKINGWVDTNRVLEWEQLPCLRNTIMNLLPRAFEHPVLEIIDEDTNELGELDIEKFRHSR